MDDTFHLNRNYPRVSASSAVELVLFADVSYSGFRHASFRSPPERVAVTGFFRADWIHLRRNALVRKSGLQLIDGIEFLGIDVGKQEFRSVGTECKEYLKAISKPERIR